MRKGFRQEGEVKQPDQCIKDQERPEDPWPFQMFDNNASYERSHCGGYCDGSPSQPMRTTVRSSEEIS